MIGYICIDFVLSCRWTTLSIRGLFFFGSIVLRVDPGKPIYSTYTACVDLTFICRYCLIYRAVRLLCSWMCCSIHPWWHRGLFCLNSWRRSSIIGSWSQGDPQQQSSPHRETTVVFIFISLALTDSIVCSHPLCCGSWCTDGCFLSYSHNCSCNHRPAIGFCRGYGNVRVFMGCFWSLCLFSAIFISADGCISIGWLEINWYEGPVIWGTVCHDPSATIHCVLCLISIFDSSVF